MALRNLRYIGDEILRKNTRTVEQFDERLWELLDDMKETLALHNGAGLAAPQVGVLKKVAIVAFDDVYYELINPQIIEEEGEISDLEGCLSIPDKTGYVKRPKRVKVRAQDRHGNWFEVQEEDFIARAFCHEIDHLNGILFSDMVTAWVDHDKLEAIRREMQQKRKVTLQEEPKAQEDGVIILEGALGDGE